MRRIVRLSLFTVLAFVHIFYLNNTSLLATGTWKNLCCWHIADCTRRPAN